MVHGSWAAAASAGLGNNQHGQQQNQRHANNNGQHNNNTNTNNGQQNNQGQRPQGQEQKQAAGQPNQGQQAANTIMENTHELEQRITRNVEKKMEKRFEDAYSKMMDALDKERARGDLLLKMVIKMVSSGLGGCVEKNELEAAGLSGDQIRNSQQQDRRGKKVFIPTTNESLARLEEVITNRQSAKSTVDLPTKPQQTNGKNNSTPNRND